MFVRCAFLIVPDEQNIVVDVNGVEHIVRVTHDRFLFSSAKVTNIEYVYYLGEHLGNIALMNLMVYVITVISSSFALRFLLYPGLCFSALFIFEVVDFVDFILTCNKIWIEDGLVPVSWNTLGTVLICIYLCYHKIKTDRQ